MTQIRFTITGKIAIISDLVITNTPRLQISIPEDRYYKGETTTVWHNVNVWGKLAQNAAKNLRPGSVISADVRVDYRTFEGKSFTSLTATHLDYLSNFGTQRKAS